MNARLAIKENERMERNLFNESKILAKRKDWTIEQAIDFKVSVLQKYSKNETEAAAWEIRGNNAKKMIGEFTFYKDNLITGKFHKSADEIIKEFNETEESKLEMPFERSLLNFMMVNYGSFDTLTDEQWELLYNAKNN